MARTAWSWVGIATLLCAGVGANASAAAPPDLDAVVSYETRQVLASGVVREERWRERLVRRGGEVWTERILPPLLEAHRHQARVEQAGHRQFNFESAARLVSRVGAAGTRLRYIDRTHRIVVSVPPTEYSVVGFDGRWDAAAFVVPPAVIATMKPLPTRGRERGARWLGEASGGWSHRVLWSQTRAVALRVESARRDGSFRRVVSIDPRPSLTGAALPWINTDAFVQKEYDDFMD